MDGQFGWLCFCCRVCRWLKNDAAEFRSSLFTAAGNKKRSEVYAREAEVVLHAGAQHIHSANAFLRNIGWFLSTESLANLRKAGNSNIKQRARGNSSWIKHCIAWMKKHLIHSVNRWACSNHLNTLRPPGSLTDLSIYAQSVLSLNGLFTEPGQLCKQQFTDQYEGHN